MCIFGYKKKFIQNGIVNYTVDDFAELVYIAHKFSWPKNIHLMSTPTKKENFFYVSNK
jgi:hypothetical protein